MTKITLLISMLSVLSSFEIKGQSLTGRITDSLTGEALEYASIGIIDTRFGATSDEQGFFAFEVKELDDSARIRVSMIGYRAQTFSIDELLLREGEIKLQEIAYDLEEVEVKASTEEKKVGATGFNRTSGWSGWGGMYTRKGYEMGTRIELGNRPVKVKSMHVRLHRQAFDKSYYRLHIRGMKDTLIQEELLKENIIVTIEEEDGWALIDLEPYDIVISGSVALTLEWLKVEGVNEDRTMKINDRMARAYILFKNQKKVWGLYRWGTEAKWIINQTMSPSMYLTILE